MDVDLTKTLKKYTGIIISGFFILTIMISFILMRMEQQPNAVINSEGKIVHGVEKIFSPSNGVIQEIRIEEGEGVEQGSLVMIVQKVLSDEDLLHLQQNLELSKKNLEQMQNGYIVTGQNSIVTSENNDALAAAQSRVERMNTLYEMGAISAAKRNEAVTDYESMKASLNVTQQKIAYTPDGTALAAVKQKIKTIEETIQKSQAQTEGIELLLPTKGTIEEIFVFSGDRVQKGDELLQINNSDSVWIETDIDEADIDKVYLGQMVSYILNHKAIQGTVQEITDMTEDEQGSTDRKRVSISIPIDIDIPYVNEGHIELHFMP